MNEFRHGNQSARRDVKLCDKYKRQIKVRCSNEGKLSLRNSSFSSSNLNLKDKTFVK